LLSGDADDQPDRSYGQRRLLGFASSRLVRATNSLGRSRWADAGPGRSAAIAGRLEGKVAFITGAARGQGRSHAIRLAEEGANVIAVDICAHIGSVPYDMATLDDLSVTVRAIEKIGRKVIASQADVRSFTSLDAALAKGVAEFGRLDIVSANAGVVSARAAHRMAEETWQDVIDVNLTGAWHTAKAAIPHLIAGGQGGSIVLTSSATALKPSQNLAHYIAAKCGVIGLMKTLALELAPYSIRVNALAPGAVNTEMIMNSATYRLFRPDLADPSAADAAGVLEGLHALPVSWVEPGEVSNALVFLASDEGKYITGTVLPVDAGWAVR
jgi:(+)-trans-carveol dehydrogenase